MSKLTSLTEAVSSVKDGSLIATCGFAVARNPIAFFHELIRQGKKSLTLCQSIAGVDTDLLIGSGAATALIYGGGSMDRFGPVFRVNEAIANKTIDVQEYSVLSMASRYLAGSLGLPYIPTNTIFGSDILKNLLKVNPPVVMESTCPFTGGKNLLIKALTPDVGIIHANYADSLGNAILYGPTWDIKEMSYACKRVIITADQVVSTDFFRRSPESTTISEEIVDMVVEVPYGAFPTGVFRSYDYDSEHMKLYAAASKNAATYKEYLDKYVYGTKNHNEFLMLCGGLEKIFSLRSDPVKGYKS